MPTDVLIKNHRRSYGSAETGGESRPQSVERLTAETNAVLDRFGVRWSASKTSRTVRTYLHTVQNNGFELADYIANQVLLSEHQRRLVADELRRVTVYADPVGELAVSNVLRASVGIAS